MKGSTRFLISLLVPLLLNSHTLLAAQPNTIEQEIIKKQHGKLVWADLYTGDVEASLKFYRDTFGWTAKEFAKDKAKYHILYDDGQAIAGVLARVSGSVSYGMGYGSGYGSGYGYPMYYGNGYRSHSNIVVVRPTKNSRIRPSRAKRR